MILKKINEFLWLKFHDLVKVSAMRRRVLFVLFLLWLPISPSLWADQSWYQRDYLERMTEKAAKRIEIYENNEVSRPFQELGPICARAKQPQHCRLRVQREALRRGGDAVIDFKFSGEILSSVLTCTGTLVKWQEPESQQSPESAENSPETQGGKIQ